MRGYMELVDRYAKLAADPSESAISAILTAGDILRPRGPEAALGFFGKILETNTDPVIQRAIRLQMVDIYRQSNQPDKALVEIEKIIAISSPKK